MLDEPQDAQPDRNDQHGPGDQHGLGDQQGRGQQQNDQAPASSAADSADDLPRPPRSRRAASRPAGPPQPISTPPAQPATVHGADGQGADDQGADGQGTGDQDAPGAASDAGTGAVSEEPTPEAKPARRRTTRKKAESTTDTARQGSDAAQQGGTDEPVTGADNGSDAGSEKAPAPRKRASRSRGAAKSSSTQDAEARKDDGPSEQTRAELSQAQQTAREVEQDAVQTGRTEGLPGLREGADEAPSEPAQEAAEEEAEDAASAGFGDSTPEALQESLRAALSNPFQPPTRTTERSARSAEARGSDAEVESQPLQPDGSRSGNEQGDQQDRSDQDTDTQQQNRRGGGRPDRTDDDSEDRPEGSEDSADSDDDQDSEQGSGRRRRRRRGGRRRRRGGDSGGADNDNDDSEDDSDDSGAGSGVDDKGSAQQSGDRRSQDKKSSDKDSEGRSSDGKQGSQDKKDSGEDSSGADKSGSKGPDSKSGDSKGEDDDSDSSGRRRRRRRRRRGESSEGDDDDNVEVVDRVREPRRSRDRSDEVTGIEGSTRMEAKRQRRKEGRAAGRRRTPILSEAEFLARRESVERTMVIRQNEELSQIAVLEDEVLVEHYVDRASATSLIGNVYLGRVQNVLPGMEAAFIDIGRDRNAVLYAGEVDWDSFGAEGQNRKVEKVFKSGQSVLVQVTKDPVGAKGARLTNNITLPGRYIVYAPHGHISGISRKLPDTERKRLKSILAELVADEASVIVRTAAEGASEEELVRDVNRLQAQWEAISKKASGSAPQQLYAEPDATVRIVRDLFTEDFSKLVIEGNQQTNDAYDTVTAYVSHVAPHLAERIEKWDGESSDVFAAHRIDEQIAKALERKVFLPSGGSLVIDRTEAMTVIDVNTGKFTGGSGSNLEATVTSNNLEAAEEVVRQLRLRDIGGIIVVDFIDMVLPSNRELLLRRLVECLGRDRTRHQVAEVTSLGLVQMTRKKIGAGLHEAFTEPCTSCGGRGYHIHDMPVETQQLADEDSSRGGRGRRRGGKDSSSGGQGGSRKGSGGGRGGNNRSEQNKGSDSQGSDAKGSNGKASEGNGSDASGEISKSGDSQGQSKNDQSKSDQGKGDQPKGDQAKGDQGKGDQPKSDQPKGDQAKSDQPKGGRNRGHQNRGGQQKGEQDKGTRDQDTQDQSGQEKGAQDQGGANQGSANQGDSDRGVAELSAQSTADQPGQPDQPKPQPSASDAQSAAADRAAVEGQQIVQPPPPAEPTPITPPAEQ